MMFSDEIARQHREELRRSAEVRRLIPRAGAGGRSVEPRDAIGVAFVQWFRRRLLWWRRLSALGWQSERGSIDEDATVRRFDD
jgi:hypothetical protein